MNSGASRVDTLTTASRPGSLKQRMIGAGSWSLAGYAAAQLLRFASNLALTRLLTPDMFGVMAVAYVVIGGLAMFFDLGVNALVIRSERAKDAAFLNTAWSIRVLQGIILWLIALGVASLIVAGTQLHMIPKDSVYADPRTAYVIATVSFISVLRGFTSNKLWEANRDLDLRRLTLIEILSQLSGLVVIFGWIAVDRSIWALVAGAIIGVLVRTILSHSYLNGTPSRWHWDKSAVREIFHFGKWIALASVIGFLANSGDRLLLGGMVGPTVLGIYSIAFFIFKTLDEVIANVIIKVIFPALSEIVRERPHHLKTSYYRVHAIISSSAYFCAGILMISGQELIGFIYDPRYYQAGRMLQILSIALLATPFGVAERCFVALGLPKYIAQVGAVSLVILVIGTIGGFHLYGLIGAVWGIALSFFSSVPLVIYYQAKHDILDIRRELYALLGLPAGLAAGLLLNVILAHL